MNFSFNASRFNFWPIYDCIKRFYPLGIKKELNAFYNSYLGLQELKSIIEDNIHNTAHFNERWVKFNKVLEEKYEMTPIGTTYGQAPSFSSFIEIDRKQTENLTRVKKIHFIVSLLGDFYTVIGEDLSEIKFGDRTIYSTNYYIVSPIAEFTEYFTFLCSEIESHFLGYRFVPNAIYEQTIEGLHVNYTDDYPGVIFTAIFNREFYLKRLILGDKYFKNETWGRSDVDRNDEWRIFPPNGDSENITGQE
jgi:hypothetical protein